MRDEKDFSEKALREVAEENGDETDPVSSNNEMDGNSINSDAEELGGEIVSTRDVSNSKTHDIDTTTTTTDNINFDELHCFQLRTRVLGLNIKFSELWKYLQIAGWTYVGGIYHIPKGKRQSTKYGAEGMAKKIYKHFNIDETKYNNQNGGKQTHGGDESDDDFDEDDDCLDLVCVFGVDSADPSVLFCFGFLLRDLAIWEKNVDTDVIELVADMNDDPSSSLAFPISIIDNTLGDIDS